MMVQPTDPLFREKLQNGPVAGLQLGGYTLIDELGQGPRGRVFRAHDSLSGTVVALTIIDKQAVPEPISLERFPPVSHPNVARTLEVNQVHGILYFASEYVEGSNLAQLVQRLGPVPIAVGCEYIRQITSGLQAIHQHGLTHRQIQPSKLIVTQHGQVKIIGLGWAALQENHRQTADSREDIAALGVTFFYLLTGAWPEDESSVQRLRSDLPEQFDSLIKAMMAKTIESPDAIIAAVTPYCQSSRPVQATPVNNEPIHEEEVDAFSTFDASQNDARPRQSSTRSRSKKSRGSIAPYVTAFFGCLIVAAVASLGYYFYSKESQVAEPIDGPNERIFENAVGITMVRIEGVTFMMGSADDAAGHQADESPVRRVTLGTFYISQHEITHQQFARVLPGQSRAVNALRMKQGGQVPEDSVSWNDAVALCRKLNELDSKLRAGWSYRLPTEAEWEYACRAGTTTPFCYGNVLEHEKDANFDLQQEIDAETELGVADLTMKNPEKFDLPRPVGTFRRTPNDLYDMHGNVWEWTSNYYQPSYDNLDSANPTGPEQGFERVIRGGSYLTSAAECRSASRGKLPVNERRPDVGFRVVLAPTSTDKEP